MCLCFQRSQTNINEGENFEIQKVNKGRFLISLIYNLDCGVVFSNEEGYNAIFENQEFFPNFGYSL